MSINSSSIETEFVFSISVMNRGLTVTSENVIKFENSDCLRVKPKLLGKFGCIDE